MRGLTLLLAVLGALALMFLWSWWQYASERDAIVGIPGAERKAFYDRTLETLRTTCSSTSEGLNSYCADQADLVVQFPECDQACRELAQSRKERPTR